MSRNDAIREVRRNDISGVDAAVRRRHQLARYQQWAVFCMAVWLTGTIISAVVATQNFYTIDRLLEISPSPEFRAAIDTLGSSTGRDLLRYLSSELNRLYFQYWNLAQLPVGILALWFVVKLPEDKRAKWGIVAMLGVSLFLMAVLTPPIIRIGRSLDFVPRDPAPPGLRTFGLLHAAFSVFTFINIVLGVMVTRWTQRVLEARESPESKGGQS